MPFMRKSFLSLFAWTVKSDVCVFGKNSRRGTFGVNCRVSWELDALLISRVLRGRINGCQTDAKVNSLIFLLARNAVTAFS